MRTAAAAAARRDADDDAAEAARARARAAQGRVARGARRRGARRGRAAQRRRRARAVRVGLRGAAVLHRHDHVGRGRDAARDLARRRAALRFASDLKAIAEAACPLHRGEDELKGERDTLHACNRRVDTARRRGRSVYAKRTQHRRPAANRRATAALVAKETRAASCGARSASTAPCCSAAARRPKSARRARTSRA